MGGPACSGGGKGAPAWGTGRTAPHRTTARGSSDPRCPRTPRAPAWPGWHLRPAEWRARQAEIGRYPSIGADWRTDTRCGATGNPTDPVYREWTHKEVWDLITNSGANADPRDVRLRVDNPVALAGRSMSVCARALRRCRRRRLRRHAVVV